MKIKEKNHNRKHVMILSILGLGILLSGLVPTLNAIECYTQGPPGITPDACKGKGGFTSERWAETPGHCNSEGNCVVLWKFRCRDDSVQTSSSHMFDPVCRGLDMPWWPYFNTMIMHAI